MSDESGPKTHKIDRTDWPEGPWNHEPDRVDFEHAGLPCLLLRGPMGVWCGYAAVPPGHRLHGVTYDDAPAFEVHWGLTFAGRCTGPVCHVPKPSMPADVWWFGFDCGHAGDYVPDMEATLRKVCADRGVFGAIDEFAFQVVNAVEASGELAHPTQAAAPRPLDKVYRDVAYARAQTEHLAEQLAAEA